MAHVIIFSVSLITAIFLVPLGIKIGYRLNILSRPKKEKKGKPCLGGIAIYIAFLASLLLAYFLRPGIENRLLGLLLSSTMIVILGLVDDIRDLRPFVKITVELLVIAFLISAGFVTKIAFLPSWANAMVTFMWVLAIINAFNLLDIVDGLTSGLVIVISSTLLAISLINKDIFSSMVLTALLGAHLGFIKYNYPPARVYMGDAGSLFSGFVLATIAIKISYAPIERPVALITPILAMSLPIYDTLFLIIMRVRKKKPIFSKTDDHFALRLVTMGNSVNKSIWIMYAFSVFLAVSSLIVAFGSNAMGIFVIIIVALVFIFMGKKVGVVKVND